jgi:hypothetical protein
LLFGYNLSKLQYFALKNDYSDIPQYQLSCYWHHFYDCQIWIFEHFSPSCYLALWLFLNEANFRLFANISDNLIEDLPSSVCNLSHLKSLCLDNNNVKQVLFSCFKALVMRWTWLNVTWLFYCSVLFILFIYLFILWVLFESPLCCKNDLSTISEDYPTFQLRCKTAYWLNIDLLYYRV